MFPTWVILSAMLLVILTVGLWLLRVPHPLSAAGLITLLDLLPLIGSGLILLPWGFWTCQGRTALGVGSGYCLPWPNCSAPSWNPGCWGPAQVCRRWP